MPYRTLRKSWRYFPSVAAFLLLAGTLIYCAWVDFDDRSLSSFAPEVMHNDDYKPFFYTADYFYDSPEFVPADFRQTNVDEWYTFFDSKVAKEDLDKLLYTSDSTADYIKPLIAYASGKISTMPAAYAGNSLFKVADKQKKQEFLSYLHYAKSCEPYATKYKDYYGWGDDTSDPHIGPDSAKSLIIAAGQKLLKEIKLPFIRQRIYFQMVRMHFMTGNYNGCIAYFNAHSKEIESFGTLSIRYRTMSYAALAGHYAKHYALSNYLYSRIFDSFPPLRQNAMLFYSPAEDSDWHQSLAMARTPHEKTVLWAMTGIAHRDEPTAIDEIYRLEPSSDLIDLLLVRAANLAEGNTSSEGPNIEKDTAYRHYAYRITKRHMSDERLHTPALWSLCAGFLSDDTQEAAQFYDRAISQAHADSLLIAQVHLLQVWNRTWHTTQIDQHTDSVLLADLGWIGSRQAPLRTAAMASSVRTVISGLYLHAHDTIMAQIAVGQLWMDYFSRDSNAYSMIGFIEHSDHTPLQDYLIRGYTPTTADMWYSLGLLDIYKDDLTSARIKWLTSGNNTSDTLYGDPFLIHIRDCHDCDHAAPQKQRYTRMDLLNKIIALEKTAKADKSVTAQTYFTLANAFYNITYSGNARMFFSNGLYNEHVAYSLEGGWDYGSQVHSVPEDSFHIARAEIALKYYLRARDASRDKEFKAKCTYMAAKCLGTNYQESELKVAEVEDFYGPYFKELREKYSNTAYARDLIRECTYYRNYMAHFPR